MTRSLALTLAVLAGLSSSTLAEPAAAPGTFPPDSVALPLNARPVFFGTGGDDATFVRVDANGETQLSFESRPSTFDQRAFTVDPGVLEPSTTLVIEGSCGGFCTPPGEWAVIDAVDDAPPTFAGDVVATAQRSRLGTIQTETDVLTISIASLEDQGGPILVRVVGDEVDEVQPQPLNSGAAEVRALLPPGPARTLCVTLSAIDVAGNEEALPDDVCASFSGCSQAPAATMTLLALPALLALLWRRARARA